MMRHISCIPKSKLSSSNMIASGMLIVEDGAVSDIGLHGPFSNKGEPNA
jgi:hypothetical protein